MALRMHAVSFDSADPERPAAFWAALLDRSVVRDGGALLLPGDAEQTALRFVAADTMKVGQNHLHLHLTGDDVPSSETVATALGLGATELDLGNPPDADFVVLADPDGNEFCVCDGGNSYLAECGFLGEVACDGSRAVGLFWAEVLGWPLVWDEGAETAIQSPRGGTKISWGGEEPPASPRSGRQSFELTVPSGGVPAELDRLVALGAVRLDGATDGVHRLADPDGTAFTLTLG